MAKHTETPVLTPPIPVIPVETSIPVSITLKALEAKTAYESLVQQAIDELLAKREEINEQLIRLGHTDTPSTPIRTAVSSTKTNRPCRVCGKYGHDARSHRRENIARLARSGTRSTRK